MECVAVSVMGAKMLMLRVVEFAKAPGGRFRKDGPNSGEWFRDDILVPQLRKVTTKNDPLVVELDGAPGYGSSFLEEAFGGLIRLGLFTATDLRERLVVRASTPLYAPYQRLAERYMREATPERVVA